MLENSRDLTSEQNVLEPDEVRVLGGAAILEQPVPHNFEMHLPGHFESETLNNLHVSAEILATAQELYDESSAEQAVQDVERQFEDAIDNYTLEHMRRATKFGLILGLELGIDKDRLRLFTRAMRIHDAGKLKPEIQELIYADRAWGPNDRAIADAHAVEGMEDLADKGLTSIELGIIGGHHLRKAKNGYGVTEERLPMSQRDEELEELATMADISDALCSARPYHETTRTHLEASTLILQEAKVRAEIKNVYARVALGVAA